MTPRPASPEDDDSDTEVFVLGISGSLGGRVARRLLTTGTRVRGLVRTSAQREQWLAHGAETEVAELTTATVTELAAMLRGTTTIVYAAGSNGGPRETTDTIDVEGLAKTVAAAEQADIRRLILVSVMPEAWRDRMLDEDEEHYFAAKKRAEVMLTRSSVNWTIVRPSLLLDEPGTGGVSLGPAEIHRGVPRDDVADVLVALIGSRRGRRQILELDRGHTPIAEAVDRALAG